MKGDFSRLRFERSQNYVAVLQQQGRVALDADANEQCFIDDHLRGTETIDVIGPWGGPEGDYGFKVTVENGAIQIGRGRYYVEGILCENEDPLAYSQQPYLINPNPTDATLLGNLQPPNNSINVIQVYLEVWQRLVTGLDDPCLLEPALGQADTTLRLQTVWRVVAEGTTIADRTATMVLPEGEIRATCCKDMTHLLVPRSTGEMMVPPMGSADECSCQPTPQAGYRGLENQLYRVEIHESGDETTATFKWSRDNGSIVVALTSSPNGTTVNVDSLGFDANLGFSANQWVELSDDTCEFGQTPNQPGSLYQIQSTNPSQLYVTVSPTVPGGTVDATKNARMRRWDQFGSTAGSNGVPLSVGSPVPLENGIQVQFTKGYYLSGDYWLIPARTGGQIEWPPCGSNGNPCQPPQGIEIHRAPLACIQWDQQTNQAVVQDCRRKFPPLTEIKACEVWYNPKKCPQLESAHTVQQALDILCKEATGPCTIVPEPGTGWQTPLLALPAGADADICFPIGKFPLTAPLVLQNLGCLRLSGGGPGTIIAGTGVTAALIFSGCKSVQISDLCVLGDSAQTRAVRSGGNTALLPGGTLSFVNCQDVSVENVWAQCGYAEERLAACISVENTITASSPPATKGTVSPQSTGSGEVRIRHCNLSVGRNQNGILLVQVQRAQVEDNILTTYAPKQESFSARLQNKTFRANVVHELVAEVEYAKATTPPAQAPSTAPAKPPATGESTPPASSGSTPTPSGQVLKAVPLPIKILHINTTVSVGTTNLTFRTNSLLKDFWQSYLNTSGPKTFSTNRDMLLFLKKTAADFLLHPKTRENYSAIASVLASLERTDQVAMARGIVVAGEGVQECRILNNSIQDAVLGITVGMSDHKLNPHTRESASVVTIAGNQISMGLPPGAQFHARHAIFVGNVNSLVIENNYASLSGTNPLQVSPLEAIWIYGVLGNRVIVRHNHIVGFNWGIVINALNPPTILPSNPNDRPLWLVAENIAENATTVVWPAAGGNVIEANNFS